MKDPTLWDMIKHEIDMGQNVVKLNGDENHKHLKKDKKGTWMWKYCSTTRTVLRNLWLCDYIESLMQHLYSDEKLTIKKAAKSAYKKTLGNHHPVLLK